MSLIGEISPWGYGSIRNFTPSNLGGPYGSPSKSLPVTSNSAYYGYPGYSGTGVMMKTNKLVSSFGTNKRACSFGGTLTLPQGNGTRSMTPGGVTTEKGWGYYKYGKSKVKRHKSKRRKSKRRYGKSKVKRRSKSKRRYGKSKVKRRLRSRKSKVKRRYVKSMRFGNANDYLNKGLIGENINRLTQELKMIIPSTTMSDKNKKEKIDKLIKEIERLTKQLEKRMQKKNTFAELQEQEAAQEQAFMEEMQRRQMQRQSQV